MTSSLIQATPGDAARIDAFLAPHAVSSMYLRGNLANHGVGITDAAHSTDFYLWQSQGTLQGVFGITRSGYLMAQMPGMTRDAARAFGQTIHGRISRGMTGPADQVELVLCAMGLQDGPFQLHHDEPLYQMDLTQLDGPVEPCRPMQQADLDRLIQWFEIYTHETGLFDAETARAEAPARAQADLAAGRLRLLEEGGEPVAMAALNAVVKGHAQVGGVYVPAEHRRKGYGARITRALLQEARANGIRSANLFANSPGAARVYDRIGFKQVGWYRIALLAQPTPIPGDTP